MRQTDQDTCTSPGSYSSSVRPGSKALSFRMLRWRLFLRLHFKTTSCLCTTKLWFSHVHISMAIEQAAIQKIHYSPLKTGVRSAMFCQFVIVSHQRCSSLLYSHTRHERSFRIGALLTVSSILGQASMTPAEKFGPERIQELAFHALEVTRPRCDCFCAIMDNP